MRSPSQTWEQIPLPWIQGGYLWAWFFPGHAPSDVLVRLPDEFGPVLHLQTTMRHLLAVLGLQPGELQFWSVQGMTIDPHGGSNPLLDQPLPAPVPWADSTITLRTHAPMAFASAPPAANPAASAPFQATAAPMTAEAQTALSGMEADWNAVLTMESQLAQLRKQLNAAQSRLQSMNRDFTPEERQAADSNDVKNWQDARRFLRDAAGHTSRYIREFDVGITSAAGHRNRFEEIYKNYVVPRKAFEGITGTQHELEVYRKQVQSLLAKMQTALSNAGSNGEQRAQQVLSRVSAKMRRSRNRE